MLSYETSSEVRRSEPDRCRQNADFRRPSVLLTGDAVFAKLELQRRLTLAGIAVATCVNPSAASRGQKSRIDVVVIAANSDEEALRHCHAVELPHPHGVIIRAQASRSDEWRLALAAAADAYAEDERIPELVMVLSALCRRISRLSPLIEDNRRVFQSDGWQIDRKAREITAPDGGRRNIGPRSFWLLEALFREPMRTVPYEELAAAGGIQRTTGGVTRSLGVYIHRLRQLLRSLDGTCDLVVNVRGHGYRLKHPAPQAHGDTELCRTEGC